MELECIKKGKEQLYKGKELLKQGNSDEALEWLYNAKKITNEYYPDNHALNTNLMKNLGLCLYKLRSLKEAYKYLKIYTDSSTKITFYFKTI